MRKRSLLPATLALVLLAAPGGAAAAAYVPGQVLVKYKHGTAGAARAATEADTATEPAGAIPGGSTERQITDGKSVKQKLVELRKDPDVAYAVPNYQAHIAGDLIPNDPAFRLQWNLSGPFGINMPAAWGFARQAGSPGARGVRIATLDTGVAYRTFKRFRRAPDLRFFLPGYDFVDGDRYPLDENGHGTHVAGTIAESTNNHLASAGIAYRARIMPIRVLDSEGTGNTSDIARGIRYAARHKIQVINLSLEFGTQIHASQIPDVLSAIRYAHGRGVTIVAAAGNQADSQVAYPARAPGVIAVAATTDRGCEADYSDAGTDVDVSAPGGGVDAPNDDNPWDQQHCRPDQPGRDIYQQTFNPPHFARFGVPSGYEGTSMAAPHVTGIAALLIGTKRLGRHPSPRAIELRIEQTARDAGPPGFDARYGWGLVDAAAALNPAG
jgi:serine protease